MTTPQITKAEPQPLADTSAMNIGLSKSAICTSSGKAKRYLGRVITSLNEARPKALSARPKSAVRAVLSWRPASTKCLAA